MKAAYIELVGPPQTIEYGDLPMPTVGRKDILVKVEAVTVNGVDTYIRSAHEMRNEVVEELTVDQRAKTEQIEALPS